MIRRARADDADALAELTTQLGYPTTADEQANRLAPLLESPDDAVLVAVDSDDHAMGWIHVTRERVLEHDERAAIYGLVIGEEHRSAGIGTELLDAAEEWAAARGIAVMLVRSRTSRERAHRFYERAGYRLVKTSHVLEKPIG